MLGGAGVAAVDLPLLVVTILQDGKRTQALDKIHRPSDTTLAARLQFQAAASAAKTISVLNFLAKRTGTRELTQPHAHAVPRACKLVTA